MTDAETREAVRLYKANEFTRQISLKLSCNELDILAQLNDRSVTEEARKAMESWIERGKTDSKVRLLRRYLNAGTEVEQIPRGGVEIRRRRLALGASPSPENKLVYSSG